MSKEFLFTKTHEWVQFLDDTTARIGISDYAQSELGDLVFINLPEEGDEVIVGESFADVESVKAVSNVYSPVTGTVKSINKNLLDQPELVNMDAMDAWFVEVEGISDKGDLLSEEEYKKLIAE
ncbi:MAG TPA: glycine cleavage system protein GcvH [Clostridiales bacterium]|jgi:glycine cleavage system H protein|nr:glycine cleavage system protein GcvH [Clostridiales bacterium]